jgi:hypothetical protein
VSCQTLELGDATRIGRIPFTLNAFTPIRVYYFISVLAFKFNRSRDLAIWGLNVREARMRKLKKFHLLLLLSCFLGAAYFYKPFRDVLTPQLRTAVQQAQSSTAITGSTKNSNANAMASRSAGKDSDGVATVSIASAELSTIAVGGTDLRDC